MTDFAQDSSKDTADVNGPGSLYKPYMECENVVEKLKLLNYEQDYVKLSSRYRLISRYHL